MKFRIIVTASGSCRQREYQCSKDNLLRTAELELKLPQSDIISLIAFMATSSPGHSIELSVGRLYRDE